MPTYQYACTECGHGFEAVQSFTDDALTACPQCAGRLRKVFNSVGIVFKGSGFYRNDSREKATSGTAKSDEKSGAKADLKPDAKPAGAKAGSGASTSASNGSGDSSASSTSSSGSGSKPGRSSTEGSAA